MRLSRTLTLFIALAACCASLLLCPPTFLAFKGAAAAAESSCAVQEDATITIASFNIQVFGTTKAGKPEIMAVLAETIAEFDIVAIQEVRDSSETAIRKLEAAVDALGADYAVIIGPRLGRTQSKEQYAFMYRTASIEPMGQAYTYVEPEGADPFHREPFIAKFKAKAGSFDFVLITVHTDPDEATEEIHALAEVLVQAKAHYQDEADLIILGDVNADCDYYDESQPNPVPGTEWLILNSADTTVKKTVCTCKPPLVSATQK